MKKLASICLALLMLFSTAASFAAGETVQLMASVSTPSVVFASVTNGVRVTISCSTSDAEIYYTLDGTTPTIDSSLYDGQFVIEDAGTYVVKARAYKSGSYSSTYTSASRTVSPCGYSEKVTSYFSLTSSSGKYKVNFNIPSGYTVYYTTGNTRPTTSSANAASDTLYVSKPTTVNMLVCRTGYAPERITELATVSAWAGKESVSEVVPATVTESYDYGKKVLTLSTATEGATIYYKVSVGSSPADVTTSNGTKYTGPITLTGAGNHYIKAIAVKTGYFDSDQYEGYLTISKLATPTISVGSKDANGRRAVTVSAAKGSEVYYTTNGTTPTTSSARYYGAGSVYIGQNVTFKAISAAKGYVTSSAASSSVSASGGNVIIGPTVVTDLGNSANGARNIKLSCETSGARIYYEITDQSVTSCNVTASSTLYSSPIVIDKTGDYYIWIRSYVDGYYGPLQAIKVSANVTDGVAIPGYSTQKLSNGIMALTLTAPEGCRVYYVLSSSVPSEFPMASATRYTYPITINKPVCISAVAVDASGKVSDMLKMQTTDKTFPNGEVTPDKVSDNITMTQTQSGSSYSAVLSCTDADADLFYVLDSSPSTVATTADTAYTKGSAIALTSGGYLHVTAAKPGYTSSSKTFTVNINHQKTAAPIITLYANADTGRYTVHLESSTPNARFYYTVDGTEPATTSTEAVGGFAANVNKGATFKVIAVADGFAPSDTVTRVISDEDPSKNTAKVYVGSVTGRPGDTVTIPVTIAENPGIAGFNFTISYDKTKLTPAGVEKGGVLTAGSLTSNIYQGGDMSAYDNVTAFWSNPSNISSDGEILKLMFKIADGAAVGSIPVSLTYSVGNITNQDMEDVTLSVFNGSVEVTNVKAGDVFGDGQINTKDSVRLGQYLAQWNIELTPAEFAAADVYKDGSINTKDSVLLDQYLAEWNVTIGEVGLMETGKIGFKVQSAQMSDDGYVDVPVEITQNSGVAGYKLRIDYDSKKLTPVSIASNMGCGNFNSNLNQSGYDADFVTAFWSNPSNVDTTGIAFTVRFKVADGAADNIPVTLSYSAGDICDQSLNDLEVETVNGAVLVSKGEAGRYTVNSLDVETPSNGSVYAKISVTKMAEGTAEDVLVIAVYKDGALMDMTTMQSLYAQGQTVTFRGRVKWEEGCTVKAFVWDSLGSMEVLSNSLEK